MGGPMASVRMNSGDDEDATSNNTNYDDPSSSSFILGARNARNRRKSHSRKDDLSSSQAPSLSNSPPHHHQVLDDHDNLPPPPHSSHGSRAQATAALNARLLDSSFEIGSHVSTASSFAAPNAHNHALLHGHHAYHNVPIKNMLSATPMASNGVGPLPSSGLLVLNPRRGRA